MNDGLGPTSAGRDLSGAIVILTSEGTSEFLVLWSSTINSCDCFRAIPTILNHLHLGQQLSSSFAKQDLIFEDQRTKEKKWTASCYAARMIGHAWSIRVGMRMPGVYPCLRAIGAVKRQL